ncbi:triose-phosphate isomerase [Murdochiella massiliensis]|uniref:triose-phosphate isomerase n=1 Tax=Murdochiella massiliensis TaxID=1673723 RepID=UPI00082EB477|nr:triose-phosphate isomerase [Murdochiella massiliensis]
MRKPLIAGNWKMNKTPYQAQMLVRQIDSIELDDEVEALVCVPAVDLQAVNEVMDDTQLHLGAQNMHYEDHGAYTGEISAAMLKDLQVEYVILGHSERRELFGESDALIQKKVDAALAKGLLPILCVGETLEEREAGKQEEKVQGQLMSALQNVKPDDFKKLVIAYEPIWAIGTGKTASDADAEEMAAFIRRQIATMISPAAAENVRILYGGSVKPENIKKIMEQENIDGALVGGASLEAPSFISLVNYRLD